MISSPPHVVRIDDYKEGEKPKSKIWFYIVGAAVAVFVGGLSFYWFIYSGTHISTDDAFIDIELSPVNSRMVGFVSKVLVSENEVVHKGQTLVVFDDTDLKVEYRYKRARLEKANSDMSRAEKLKRSRAISLSDYENAKASLSSMQADFDGTMLKLRYTEIKSPEDGVIGKKNIQVGQFVQPGQGLFVVVPLGPIWIKANYKETQLEKIKTGMKVIITVDAYPGITWYGRVDSVAPTSGSRLSLLPPENASGNFTKVVQRIPVRIKLISKMRASYPLRAGMSVTSTVLVSSDEP